MNIYNVTQRTIFKDYPETSRIVHKLKLYKVK
jgi:hypothetical protein